jgi:hypothetical protein
MSQSIEIVVAPDGQTRLRTLGFTGPACLDASKRLEDALGLKTSEELTSEFHQTALNAATVRRIEQQP